MNRSTFVPALSPAQVEYRHYLNSPRWRILRWLRLRLDGHRCRMCGSSERLEVHHRSYDWRGAFWLWELLDLTTLCRRHHEQYHKGG